MNQCKIIKITPDGKPWDSQYGRMYPFYVVFEDGGAGTTNSKSETPPYKVGDEVGYDITGATPKGVPKIKITRNPKPGEATYTGGGASNPDLEAARPQNTPQNRSAAPTHTQTTPHGATIGMCVKGALDVWLQQNENSGKAWGADSISFVYSVANQILGICNRVEAHAKDASQDETVPF